MIDAAHAAERHIDVARECAVLSNNVPERSADDSLRSGGVQQGRGSSKSQMRISDKVVREIATDDRIFVGTAENVHIAVAVECAVVISAEYIPEEAAFNRDVGFTDKIGVIIAADHGEVLLARIIEANNAGVNRQRLAACNDKEIAAGVERSFQNDVLEYRFCAERQACLELQRCDIGIVFVFVLARNTQLACSRQNRILRNDRVACYNDCAAAGHFGDRCRKGSVCPVCLSGAVHIDGARLCRHDFSLHICVFHAYPFISVIHQK